MWIGFLWRRWGGIVGGSEKQRMEVEHRYTDNPTGIRTFIRYTVLFQSPRPAIIGFCGTGLIFDIGRNSPQTRYIGHFY